MTEQPTAPPPPYPPPPPVIEAPRRRLSGPGPQFWWAGAAAATIVLVACAGFLVGRASVDGHDDGPVPIQRQLPPGGTGPVPPQQLPAP